MQHLYSNIPPMLKERPNWVVWGMQHSRFKAPPKMPFNAESVIKGLPAPAKAGLSASWSRYETAVRCVDRGLAQGIGFQFEGGDLYGVDLDDVIDGHGKTSQEAAAIVGQLDSYTETSPSGKGLHIFVLAPGANIVRHRKKDHFMEIYNADRYFTVTGNVFGRARRIEARASELQNIHDRIFPPAPAQDRAGLHVVPPAPGGSDEKAYRLLSVGLDHDKTFSDLWHGLRRHGNESSDDIALMNKLAYWCNRDPDMMVKAFLSSPYHSQKDEAHIIKCRRGDYLPRTALNSCSTARSTAAADYERYQQKRNTERSLTR